MRWTPPSPVEPISEKASKRVLKPGGRLQVADILVDKPIPEGARRNIDLWTG
jgi:ubiquinone/menaquinone biosynthesis C-methylase UbiE